MLSDFFPNSVKDDPVVAHKVSWGIGDAALWMLLSVLSTVLAISLYSVLRYGGELPADRSAVDLLFAQAGLWIPLFVGPWFSSRSKGKGIVVDYGLTLKPNQIVVGLVIGVLTQVGVIAALYRFIGLFVEGDAGAEAEKLVSTMDSGFDWTVLVLMVAIGAPLAEEFFYRGILLRSLQRKAGAIPAVLVSGLVFAAIHFQWFQFPGLLVVGIIAATMAIKTGSLSMPVGFHVGFNGAAAVGLVLLNN